MWWMNRQIPTAARFAAGGAAAGGILAAHVLGYVLGVPTAAERAQTLEATGHRYFGLAVALLLCALVLGLLRAGFCGFRDAIQRDTAPTGARRLVPPLLVLQVAGFAVLEVSERVLFTAHGSAADLLGETPFLLGLALQVLVALANGAFVAGFLQATRAIALRMRQRSSDAAAPRRWQSLYTVSPVAPARGAATLRAPPGPR